MAEKRRCGTCQIQKVLSFDNFYRCNQKYAKGYGHICKPCYRKRDGARRVEHNAASSRHLKKLRLAALQACIVRAVEKAIWSSSRLITSMVVGGNTVWS